MKVASGFVLSTPAKLVRRMKFVMALSLALLRHAFLVSKKLIAAKISKNTFLAWVINALKRPENATTKMEKKFLAKPLALAAKQMFAMQQILRTALKIRWKH